MLKRILIKVLARDFWAGSSSFTQSSVSFVLPTVCEIVLGTLLQILCQPASAVEVSWRASDPSQQGRQCWPSLGSPTHKQALALLMDLSTGDCQPGMVGQSRQGTMGNIPPSKCLSPSTYIYYTGNRVLLYIILEIIFFFSLCCCFFQPTANGQPYEKSNINPEVCLYLSLYSKINPEEQSKRREKVPLMGFNSHTAFGHEHCREEGSTMHSACTGAPFNPPAHHSRVSPAWRYRAWLWSLLYKACKKIGED